VTFIIIINTLLAGKLFNMKAKLILSTTILFLLFSCKKKSEDMPAQATVDPIEGEWYMHLIDADVLAPAGSNYYAYRAGGANAANRSNISFTNTAAAKSLYKFTKQTDGKYSISMTAYPGLYLSYQTNNISPYESRMFFALNQITDDYLYSFEKVTGATDTYLIKSVSNPNMALSASITNGTTLRPNFVVAGASFTYQKWKLEK
jgi:hypothetical protein